MITYNQELKERYESAQDELDTLRKELKFNQKELLKARLSLTASERRNADLVELLRDIKRYGTDAVCFGGPHIYERIDAALKHAESGAKCMSSKVELDRVLLAKLVEEGRVGEVSQTEWAELRAMLSTEGAES